MWTVSSRYQDGRGFTCVDIMFNGIVRWTEVFGQASDSDVWEVWMEAA